MMGWTNRAVVLAAACSCLLTAQAFQGRASSVLLRPRQVRLGGSPFFICTTGRRTVKASITNNWAGSSSDNNEPRKETPARRMRRRKVKIYNKKKVRATAILFSLWYILSVAYNIFSKRALNMAPELAWTAAFLQLALGLTYVFPVWVSGLRAPPQVSNKDIRRRILPVALLHALVHVGGVISMGAGAVSFTYIVKATEPAVSALLSAVFLKSFLPLPVYLTLVPVIAGVSLASVSELTFSWKSFQYAMMSNLASASRGIVSKKTMTNRVGKNLTSANLYAILTILATIVLFPVVAILEGNQWIPSFQRLRQHHQFTSYLIQVYLAAMTYYTYNEVSFMALDNISPISHALASTLRRVFIITTSMMVFGNKMTPLGAFGSSMAVGGALLYSAAKNHYKKKKAV
ncbi:Triose phosphate/phosphate translocator, chloroplastic [Seminavis robusta]|uniref:Triose phosphate/phosphate translocator, chloroplastic n=1 Tax=Seminavis robusta TaxID=568900 RepID=A0A9N8DSM1_9STRA|nr:Triose phosphate/phosphate translocator, chloroplastic [Seminavis robusta]|eukprot:Sro252_g099490.1 Triose phosphate/phosphate translocator, chloroplastic (403) ;mRNA; f:712-2067